MILFLDVWKENQKPLNVLDSRRDNGVWPGGNCCVTSLVQWIRIFKSSSCITLLKIQSKLKYIVIPKGISGDIVNDERELRKSKTLKRSRKPFKHIFVASELSCALFFLSGKKCVFYLIKIYSMVIYGCI